jgi:hypothetical protein
MGIAGLPAFRIRDRACPARRRTAAGSAALCSCRSGIA